MPSLIQLKKLFGPLRRCVQVAPNSFVCVVDTPGFTKDLLKMELTRNHLALFDGSYERKEKETVLRLHQVHEAIQLPLRVLPQTVWWETVHGVTILRCRTEKA